MKIYAIGGLGADERVFQYLSIEIHPIKWTHPFHWENMTIPSGLIRIHGDKDRLLKMTDGVTYKMVAIL